MQVSVTDAKGQLTELVRRAEGGADFSKTDIEGVLST
ncbi:hypothetical protein X739_14975 [Mesorhizobium sp. LNHC220B00]|jgi:hypothetical protein|nr:hypothetical protein X739_14975 [Mesorhizobium sp. LNHC220B00]ESY91818.1 hypothetical protein X741_22395 [Mesorhizobium sp. LNHC229A00]